MCSNALISFRDWPPTGGIFFGVDYVESGFLH